MSARRVALLCRPAVSPCCVGLACRPGVSQHGADGLPPVSSASSPPPRTMTRVHWPSCRTGNQFVLSSRPRAGHRSGVGAVGVGVGAEWRRDEAGATRCQLRALTPFSGEPPRRTRKGSRPYGLGARRRRAARRREGRGASGNRARKDPKGSSQCRDCVRSRALASTISPSACDFRRFLCNRDVFAVWRKTINQYCAEQYWHGRPDM